MQYIMDMQYINCSVEFCLQYYFADGTDLN